MVEDDAGDAGAADDGGGFRRGDSRWARSRADRTFSRVQTLWYPAAAGGVAEGRSLKSRAAAGCSGRRLRSWGAAGCDGGGKPEEHSGGMFRSCRIPMDSHQKHRSTRKIPIIRRTARLFHSIGTPKDDIFLTIYRDAEAILPGRGG